MFSLCYRNFPFWKMWCCVRWGNAIHNIHSLCLSIEALDRAIFFRKYQLRLYKHALSFLEALNSSNGFVSIAYENESNSQIYRARIIPIRFSALFVAQAIFRHSNLARNG